MSLSRAVLALVALVAMVSHAYAACNAVANPLHAFHDYQSQAGLQNTPLNQQMFWGSHDAGCYGVPTGSKLPNAWAVTQTMNLESQLCSGVRVFDLRFKGSDNNFANWRIFHGGFLFENMQTIAGYVNTFCTNNAHSDESIFLRVKLKAKVANDQVEATSMAFINAFANQIGQACIAKRTAPNAANNNFGARTLAQIKQDTGVPGANVFIVPYGDHFEDLQANADFRRTVWPYGVNIVGRFSNNVKVTQVTKGQRAKYNAWHANRGNRLFGWWMTVTGSKKQWYFNVFKNSARLFDRPNHYYNGLFKHSEGKYGKWVRTLIRDQVALHPNNGVKGMVLWTDWAGDFHKYNHIIQSINQVNINIVGNAALDTNILAVPNARALVYNFLETAVDTRRSSTRRALSRAFVNPPDKKGKKGKPEKGNGEGKAMSICADGTDDEANKGDVGANCLQSHMIPIDWMDECLHTDEVKEMVASKDTCAPCSEGEKAPSAPDCEEDNLTKEWAGLMTKVKCCAITQKATDFEKDAADLTADKSDKGSK